MQQQKPAVGSESEPIPFRLRIGVTGHRTLPEDPALATAVAHALQRIARVVPHSAYTPVRLAIISPLAEGADRLVAKAVLAEPEAILEAVLPMPAAEYEEDFASADSRHDFETMLDGATRVVELALAHSREEAYEQAGEYVVEHCDVLIAVWDGAAAQGPGGTGEVVGWARDRGTPVFWIHSLAPFTIKEWLGNGIDLEAFRQIDRYNCTAVDQAELQADLQRARTDLNRHAGHAGIESELLAPYEDWILPVYARMDALATLAQGQFFRTSDATFVMAALAVLISAGVLLVEQGSILASLHVSAPVQIAPLIECVLMGLVLAVIYLGRRQELHRRWISYRFLAERLRSALFLALVSAREAAGHNPEPISLHQPADSWIQRAFDEVWLRRPTDSPAVPVEVLRRFLAHAWINDQRRYQDKKSRRHAHAYRVISLATAAIFAGTLCIAVLDAFNVDRSGVLGSAGPSVVMYLSIILPAFAGMLGGISALREHPRNAHRSRTMAHYLARLERRMERAPNLLALRALARQTDAMMLEESGDWFVTMEPRDIEVHT